MAVEKAPSRGQALARPIPIFAAVMVAAALFYSFHLGRDPLGASEAYSAYAAARPSATAILDIPILYDPGKQLLYYVLLHYWSEIFGMSEAALRAPSVIFGVAGLAILFLLGRDLFDDAAGAGAAAMWAFTPLAAVFSFRTRMYSMLIAVGLVHVYTFHRVRDRGGVGWTVACALSGAAVIYTHLGGLAIIAAEVAILVRDLTRRRFSVAPWIALAGAGLLFAPYVPTVTAQSRVLLAGHWLDWIGPAFHYSFATKAIVAGASVVFGLWAVFGPSFESSADEPFRFCLLWSTLPVIAFAAGSIVLRPMWQIRYVSPSIAMVSVLLAGVASTFGARARNLCVVGVTAIMFFLALAMRPIVQPWGAVARIVEEAGRPLQPVFFESGFVTSGEALKKPNGGFAQGYYLLAFNYYFHGPNPRVTIPPYDPAAARASIESAASRTGGAWLVTWMDVPSAHAELPDPARYTSTLKLRGERMMIYRIVPANPPPK